MTPQDLNNILTLHPELRLKVQLPHGGEVPVSFHITEVGVVQKDFIDCGGTRRQTRAFQLQAWVGEDDDHRLSSAKLSGILGKGLAAFGGIDLPVEVEYEDAVISQYPLERVEPEGGALVFHLTTKHTDCLAKELCGLPKDRVAGQTAEAQSSCCSGGGCCG